MEENLRNAIQLACEARRNLELHLKLVYRLASGPHEMDIRNYADCALRRQYTFAQDLETMETFCYQEDAKP